MPNTFQENICNGLALTHQEFDELQKTAPERYKLYEISKKSDPSKKRKICQPAKEIKLIQTYLIENYLSRYPIHSSATAYSRGCSAYLNSKLHANSEYIAKIDFREFFNSIKANDFILFVRRNNIFEFSEVEITQLTSFLFWSDYLRRQLVLSIGAPSSPIISNILLYNFDKAVSEFSNAHACIYTRYADDITISSSEKNKTALVFNFITQNLRQTGISSIAINEEKTKFLSKKGKRIVTGYVISNDGVPTLGRDKKRIIRSMVHRALADASLVGSLSSDTNLKEKLKYLCGILGQIKSTDHAYWKILQEKYGENFHGNILSRLRSG